jgi:hypothetical protein
VSVKLQGCKDAELLRVPIEGTKYVGEVIDAAIAKFKLLEGIKADEVQLFKQDGGVRTLLDPTQTLGEAGIIAGTALVVDVASPVAPPKRA